MDGWMGKGSNNIRQKRRAGWERVGESRIKNLRSGLVPIYRRKTEMAAQKRWLFTMYCPRVYLLHGE